MDDHQQDANSALMELDKGLRAQKVGEQCEAIVRFPGLFERFPFPILINSAFLKLADVFRVGNNFLRLCILRVAQQSNKHLDKILNTEEFRKRISVVIHSNDPYARAITLRMLGSIACIISNEKSVHHSIRQGLDSHDRVEQEASIYATIQFASHSREFATSICNKIASMLQGLSTPLEIKLKLIPILQYMHYDVQVSSKSRSVLKDLLPAYPAQDFVITTLNALTSLSVHSLVDIPAQVALLLQFLRCDPRAAVKSVTLSNLNILASAAPHLWSAGDTNELCKAYSLSAMQASLKEAILKVLCTLASGNTIIQLNLNEGSELITLCRLCCNNRDVHIAALGSRLLSMLVTHAARSDQGSSSSHSKMLNEAADAVESLLLVLVPTSDFSDEDRATLEIILPAISELCQVSDPQNVSRLIEDIVSLLTIDCKPDGQVACMLCEILASIATKYNKPDLLEEVAPNLMEFLINLLELDESDESSNLQRVITYTCTLLFLSNSSNHDKDLCDNIKNALTSSTSVANKWTWYRVARQATRMGEHKLASELFLQLTSAVPHEQYYFWLRSLHQIELAEANLLSSFFGLNDATTTIKNPNCIYQAVEHYHLGLSAMRAAISPEHPMNFQCKYITLRCDMLEAHAQLSMTCKRIYLIPPPAIAGQTGAVSETLAKDDSLSSKSSFLSEQLTSRAKEFTEIAKRYGELHVTSFDADSSTLENIDILQQSCNVMAYAIDLLAGSGGNQETASVRKGGSLEKAFTFQSNAHYGLAFKRAFDTIMSKLEALLQNSDSSAPLCHEDTECLLQCSASLLGVPISYPRYFYQSLQTTVIKLAISPSQRSPNDPVTVEVNERLALKIEGVIRCGGPGGITLKPHLGDRKGASLNDTTLRDRTFRHVKKIKLSVMSSLIPHQQASKPVSNTGKLNQNWSNSLEQIVEPHHDYFSCQFLLTFPMLGNHTVTITSSLIDEKGMCWKNGPKESLLLRCYDDLARIKAQQAQSAHK